jgi:hypothetical protein
MDQITPPVVVGVVATILFIWSASSWYLTNDPLKSIPGPVLNRYTRLPLKLAICMGERANYIDRLHQQYGHFVRIAPNEVAVSELQAYKRIHRSGTGFMKADWYPETNLVYTDDNEKLGVFQIQDFAEAIEQHVDRSCSSGSPLWRKGRKQLR